MTADPVRVFAGTLESLSGTVCSRAAEDSSLTVWWLTDGTLVATDDACPHYFWSLRAAGRVDGDVLTCGVHDARFDLRTGRSLGAVTRRSMQTYPVEVSATGEVHVVRPPAPTR